MKWGGWRTGTTRGEGRLQLLKEISWIQTKLHPARLTRLGLPRPSPPFRSEGGQRGAQQAQGAVGTLGEWKRSGADAPGGTDPCSGCSPQ